MFEYQCELAALVYEADEDPDQLLCAFATDLGSRGFRAVGLVQIGHRCVDQPKLAALLLHSGERMELLQDLGSCATGCKLDVGQLLEAGARVASAIDAGADLVIINRFGRQEREGKGLSFLIERALSADIPVVIAVASLQLVEWTKFADGMSVKLCCTREALEAWWAAVSARGDGSASQERLRVCEVLK